MIDFRRATAAEREVVIEALRAREASLRLRISRTRSRTVRDDATWRRHVVADLLDQLDAGA